LIALSLSINIISKYAERIGFFFLFLMEWNLVSHNKERE
jgi:hypothetical protein